MQPADEATLRSCVQSDRRLAHWRLMTTVVDQSSSWAGKGACAMTSSGFSPICTEYASIHAWRMGRIRTSATASQGRVWKTGPHPLASTMPSRRATPGFSSSSSPSSWRPAWLTHKRLGGCRQNLCGRDRSTCSTGGPGQAQLLALNLLPEKEDLGIIPGCATKGAERLVLPVSQCRTADRASVGDGQMMVRT